MISRAAVMAVCIAGLMIETLGSETESARERVAYRKDRLRVRTRTR